MPSEKGGLKGKNLLPRWISFKKGGKPHLTELPRSESSTIPLKYNFALSTFFNLVFKITVSWNFSNSIALINKVVIEDKFFFFSFSFSYLHYSISCGYSLELPHKTVKILFRLLPIIMITYDGSGGSETCSILSKTSAIIQHLVCHSFGLATIIQ